MEAWWTETLTRLAETRCEVCRSATLYQREAGVVIVGGIEYTDRKAAQPPWACGRLACLVVADPEAWK